MGNGTVKFLINKCWLRKYRWIGTNNSNGKYPYNCMSHSLEAERMPYRFSSEQVFILGLPSMATLQKVTVNSKLYYTPGSCDSVSCIV